MRVGLRLSRSDVGDEEGAAAGGELGGPMTTYPANPGHSLDVQRGGVRARLIQKGMHAETAERWLDAWTLEALGRGLAKDGSYWQAGWDWIAAERAAGRPSSYS